MAGKAFWGLQEGSVAGESGWAALPQTQLCPPCIDKQSEGVSAAAALLQPAKLEAFFPEVSILKFLHSQAAVHGAEGNAESHH